MIIIIEGSRHVGKTHLINSFFEQNTNPNIIYYKFQFAKYIDQFDLRGHETGPGVHYFSIANVLTIFELNQTLFKDKIIIFDRCVFSAYVWSIYRERLEKTKLLGEFEKILNSDLYQNCALVYLNRTDMPTPSKRDKDYFENFENYETECKIFNEILEKFQPQITDPLKNNTYHTFTNNFDALSLLDFCKMLGNISNPE